MPNEIPSSNELSPCLSQCPAFRNHLTCLGRTVFPHNRVGGICPKNTCQQLCCFSVAPCQRSYARPIAQGLETFTNLGRTVFRDNRIDGICPEKPVPTNSSAICIFHVARTKLCMSHRPAFEDHLDHLTRVLGAQFFGTMDFVLKNPCQQLCSFSLAPCQRSYACPMAQGLETLAALGRTVFRNNRIDEICPEKPVPTAVHF